VRHSFVQWKKSPLDAVLGVTLTSIWKGGAHAYPTRATVQPAEVPGGVTLAGTVGLTGLYPRPIAAEPPPETPRITLFQLPGICTAPVAVAEALLRAEGFREVRYVPAISGVDSSRKLAAGEADFSLNFSPPLAIALDTGQAGVVLAGIHVGCMEVVAREPLRTLRELKGKRVAVWALGSVPHLFLAAMVAHVGMDPASDIEWVVHPPNKSCSRPPLDSVRPHHEIFSGKLSNVATPWLWHFMILDT
jgi:ABC-type nitrate/sulfonate/bicarbonate transport system substrate-binding protein